MHSQGECLREAADSRRSQNSLSARQPLTASILACRAFPHVLLPCSRLSMGQSLSIVDNFILRGVGRNSRVDLTTPRSERINVGLADAYLAAPTNNRPALSIHLDTIRAQLELRDKHAL
jgi:hypothetical protein